MSLKPLHDPKSGPLRVVGLLSGSGTNLRRILEHETRLRKERGESPFRVAVIFSDSSESKAAEIGRDYDRPVVIRDIRAFYRARGRKKSDLSLRPDFDRDTVRSLSPFEVSAAAYAGYMSVASSVLIQAFLGVNVHPADLSVEENGRRKYTGDHAVLDAIRAGEKTIGSTTHLIEERVDYGRILIISPPVPVEIPAGADLSNPETAKKVAAENQDRLKEKGDWIIFPQTLEYLAEGRFAADGQGLLHFDGKPIPKGLRIEALAFS